MDWRPDSDSYLTQKLRAGGFIFIGKTNLPEMAGGPVTKPLAFGPTRNPWGVNRTLEAPAVARLLPSLPAWLQ